MTGKTIGEHWLEVCADLEGQIISHKVRIEALTAALVEIRACTTEHGGAAKALRIINAALEKKP